MRIAYITAGAGRMVCGSCLRDNALAAALLDAGHDVILIPAYTPTRTDERNVSSKRVFLGGINVYLQHRLPAFRRMPAALAKLLDSPALLRFATRWGVSVDPAELGELTVSMLRGEEGPLRSEITRLVRFLADEVSPDVVNLPNSLLIALAPAIKAAIKVPVCCTLQGEDVFLNGLGEPHRNEALSLMRMHTASVDAFVPVSHYGAEFMSGLLGVERTRMRVVPLGIDLRGYGRRTGPDPEPFTVGYLARVAPEKGLHVLCAAYAHLRRLAGAQPSRLWAAGYLGREHKPYFREIVGRLGKSGLAGDFHFYGELDHSGKLAFLHGLSVLSVPGPYPDPKGLFLLEAAAAGIPVVQPRQGAFTEIVEGTGGGILTEPGDAEALAAAIYDLWQNPGKRHELAARGHEAARARFSAAQMAEQALIVYRSLTEPQSAEA